MEFAHGSGRTRPTFWISVAVLCRSARFEVIRSLLHVGGASASWEQSKAPPPAAMHCWKMSFETSGIGAVRKELIESLY
jgi:hypothetical protein